MLNPRHSVTVSIIVSILSIGGLVRYLHTVPVGTGETVISPDGHFTATALEWSSREFLTNTPRHWFEYKVQGPGVLHELVGNPIPGPYFGSRSSHRVIRWADKGNFVEFVFPNTTLRLTIGAGSSCRLTADLTRFEVERNTNGILVRSLGWQENRTDATMEFLFLSRSEALPDLDRRHGVGADEVRYAVTRQSGGSAGDDITMLAERFTDDGILRLDWKSQAEDGTEPDFTQAWAILASVEC